VFTSFIVDVHRSIHGAALLIFSQLLVQQQMSDGGKKDYIGTFKVLRLGSRMPCEDYRSTKRLA
jgi:hypothetical protein